MKKNKIIFGETEIICETASGLEMANSPILEKSSPTEIIGEVSSVNMSECDFFFEIEGFSISSRHSFPEWLNPGARVKVDLRDGTVLLLDKKVDA